MKICRRILCRSGNESMVEMLGIWTNRVTVQILSGKRKRVGRRVRAVKMKQPWTGIHSMQRAPQDGTKAVFSWHYFFYICMCQTSLLPTESNPEASGKLYLHLQYLFINGKLWLGKTCCCWRSSCMFRFSDVQQWCSVMDPVVVKQELQHESLLLLIDWQACRNKCW